MAERCDEAAAAFASQMKLTKDPDLRERLDRQSKQNELDAESYRQKALDLAPKPGTPLGE